MDSTIINTPPLQKKIEALQTSLLETRDPAIFFSLLTKGSGFPLVRYDDANEYEIKLNAVSALPLTELNRQISDVLTGAGFVICRCEKSSDYLVDFYVSSESTSSIEYSTFEYEGSFMMKIKEHHVLSSDTYKIMKSSERFIYTEKEIRKTLSDVSIHPSGQMRKTRVKDFVLDPRTGIIFSSAITRCFSSDRTQLQYELEYYSHLQLNPDMVTTEVILSSLSSAASILIASTNLSLVNTTETKLCFVKENMRNVE